MPIKLPAPWHQIINKSYIRRVGFEDEQALLPPGPRSFRGYRLLHEYFAFPQRFLFAELGGLKSAVQRCPDKELDIVVLFDRVAPLLEHSVSAANFSLFCTPAINLFPKRADRIHLTDQESEYHLVPDRTRPMDFEIYKVLGVTGYGAGPDAMQSFQPFYTSNDLQADVDKKAYFQLRRQRRILSERQRLQGPRSSYIGSEVFMSLVDAHEAPFSSGLRQLGIDTLCTNRDLALSMPIGSGKTDFTVESNAPIQSVRCISGPTIPSPSHAEGETAWRLVSHLSLNYLSLMDGDQQEGATALKDLLRLYCSEADVTSQRQIDGIRSVSAKPIVRRLPVPGPIS